MIITLINIQTSIKLYSKSFSNCLMKHFHTGIHWDIKKWGWYNQQRLESIQYWIMRLWIILILLICFLLAYLLQSIELIRLFAFFLKIINSQLNLQSFWMSDDIKARPTEGNPVANTRQFTNARNIHCSVIVKIS